MNLESKGLSAARGHSPHHVSPASITPMKATAGSSYNNSPDSSVKSNELHRGKSNDDLGSSKSRKRKHFKDENTVVIYNVSPKADRTTVKDFVERMFLEMHGKKIRIVGCICHFSLSDRLTFLVAFETSELVDLAISLNGVQLMNHTIYVSIYNPDWAKDKTWKSRLCFNSFYGGCKLGDKCRHAHGVLDLKLYHDTVLSKHRTIYISQFPFRFPHLLNTVKKKFMNHGMSPFFTAFHVRTHKQDALVEFADIRHAKKARDILNGTRIGTFEMEVHPWKPEYQSGFVKYFENEDRRTRSGGDQKHAPTLEPPAKRTRTDDTSRKDTRVPVDLTPEKQDQQVHAFPLKTQEKQPNAAVDGEDDKHELQRLRDEVSKFRWQQTRLAHLEEENSTCKKLLTDAEKDIRYYRDLFERERSHVMDFRRMENKLDDLRRENDYLIREKNDLLNRHHDPRSVGSYSDLGIDNRVWNELRDTKRKYEESRDFIDNLQCELDKRMYEMEALVRDSNRLKSTVERLESDRNRAKRENEQARHKLEDLRRENDHLIREKDDLQKRHHDPSRPVGSYRDLGIDNNVWNELRDTKLKYEESRDRINNLQCELDKTMNEKEVLLRDSKRLKSAVERLESDRNCVESEDKQAQPQNALRRRLDEALSKIETLNGEVITAHLKLKKVESEKDSANAAVADLQVQNETLQEEMDQMNMNHAMELGFMGAT